MKGKKKTFPESDRGYKIIERGKEQSKNLIELFSASRIFQRRKYAI
jgi:hypothetical protein